MSVCQKLFNRSFLQMVRETAFMSGPLIGARVGATLTGFITMVMIARLGHDELAAGALINTVQFSLLVPIWMLFIAVGVLVGQCYGAKQFAEIGKITRQGLMLGVVIGFFGMLILWQTTPILILFGQDRNLALLAGQFYQAYSWGLIPAFWYACFMNFLMGISRQKVNLFFTFLSMPLMVFFGYGFLFGKLGFHQFGISGMGYASAISFVIIDAIIVGYLLTSKKYQPYRLLVWDLNKNLHYLREIIAIGWPITAMIASELIIFSLSIIMIGWLGESSLAAQQISLQINLVAFMMPMGIGQASTILISQQVGRKNFHLIRQLGYAGMFLALIAMIVALIIYILIPKVLIGFYVDISSSQFVDTVKMAVTLLIVTGIMDLFDGVRCVVASALRGIRDTVIPMIVFVILGAVFTLPTGYFFAVVMHMGPAGYRWGFVFGYLIGTVILIHRFHKLTGKNQG